MTPDDFNSKLAQVEANLEDKIEKVNNNVELIVMAVKGNPMNPSDQGILGTIKRLEQGQDTINRRLDEGDKWRGKVTQTYVVISMVAAFLGTAIGLALALYSTLIKK